MRIYVITSVITGIKFAASVNDTGGHFTAAAAT
jgi:hypothetical protein